MTGFEGSSLMKGATKCPQCGGVGYTSPHPELRRICNLCGAPRIDLDGEGITLSGREKEPLARAKRARGQRIAWRLGSVLGAVAGIFGLGLTTLVGLIFSLGVLFWIVGIVLSVPFLLLAIMGAAKASAHGGDLQRALDEAWRSAARDVTLAQKRGIGTAELAQRLRIDEAAAERLAAEVAVDTEVHSRIDAEGQVELVPAGARIAVSEDEKALEEQFAELEQREAAKKSKA
jgi:hypothetical protein